MAGAYDKFSCVAFVLLLLLGFASCYKPMNFGTLPRGSPIPPSGPSRKSNRPPSPPPHLSSKLYFGVLPKAPLPPSGSGGKSDRSPPPYLSSKLYFGVLPKAPLPPSGPGGKSNPSPPRLSSKSYFGALPKAPLPLSGPNRRSNVPPPPLDSSRSPLRSLTFRKLRSGPSHGAPRYDIPPPSVIRFQAPYTY